MNTTHETERKNNLESTRARRSRSPRVDIYENEKELVLVADMPGVTREQLKLAIEPPELRIDATGVETGHFARAFTVDERIQVADATAELSQGVLTVKLPKVASQKPRQIPIRAAT